MTFLLLLSFFVAVVSASSLEQNKEGNRGLSDTFSCGPWPIRYDFYRAFRADVHDHFYTTSNFEWENATHNFGYTGEGVTGRIYNHESFPSIPLYRLWHTERSDHFYTTNETERDNAINLLAYRDEGIAGHVLRASDVEPVCPCPEALPLFRLFKDAPEYDHFYTMNATEKALFVGTHGYIDEGIAACIFPCDRQLSRLC